MEQGKQDAFTAIFLKSLDKKRGCEPLRHVAAYLKWRHQQSGRNLEELAAICGYRKMEKFRRHLAGWLNAGSGMPLRLACAIGVDLDELKAVIEVESMEYQEALEHAAPDDCFSIKLMPGIFQSVQFPPELSDADKVGFVEEYCQRINMRCCLGFGGLKTAWFTPGQKPYWSFCWPYMAIAQGKLVFARARAKPDFGLK